MFIKGCVLPGIFPGLLVIYFMTGAGSANGAAASLYARDVEAENWRLVRTANGECIYRRAMEGSTIAAAMISTTFAAPPARLFGIVTDYDHFAEFIPYVVESRIVKNAGDKQWVFHHLRFPGPLADRAYVIRSRGISSHFPESRFQVEWRLDDGSFTGEQHDIAMRPGAFSGFWDLRPLQDGTATAASYAVHSEPGGWVPDWLVERMTRRYLEQVVVAIRRRISAGP